MFLLFLDINRRRIAVETAAGTFPFTGFDDSICCSQPGFTFKGIAAAAAAFRQNFGNLFFPRFLSFLAVRLYSRDRVPLAFDRFLSTRSASAIFPWGEEQEGGGEGTKFRRARRRRPRCRPASSFELSRVFTGWKGEQRSYSTLFFYLSSMPTLPVIPCLLPPAIFQFARGERKG